MRDVRTIEVHSQAACQHALRELANATAALSAETRAAHVARLQARQAAERRACLDGALELRIVRERQLTT